jgi:predicted phage-related endonuclease
MTDPRYVAQGSAEWYSARVGKATASRMGDIMGRLIKPRADNPNGYTQSYFKYQRELLIERLTGLPAQHFVSAAMEWGADAEEMAAQEYDRRNKVFTDQCGFFEHPTIPGTGASPDRLVGEDGLVEIKDPTTGTHIETLLDGTYNDDYRYQMVWECECSGRAWADFVSFDPRLPENLRYYQERFVPPPELLEDMRAKVKIFLAELDAMEAKVRAYES